MLKKKKAAKIKIKHLKKAENNEGFKITKI